MAEAAGLAFGVFGAFTDAVQCFEYVQLARNFDKDYQTAVLKLDVAQLRLSRWGVSVGMDHVDQSTKMLPGVEGTAAEHEKAQELLENIVSLFDDAAQKSSKLKTSNVNTDDDDSTTTKELDLATSSLHRKLKQLSLKRFKPSNVTNKVKWALYKEKALRRLIEDITGEVNDLVSLFPAVLPEQKRLCAEEGAELAQDDNISLLMPLLEKQDIELSAAVKEQAAQRPGSTVNNVSFAGSTNKGLQQGVNYGHQTNHFGGH